MDIINGTVYEDPQDNNTITEKPEKDIVYGTGCSISKGSYGGDIVIILAFILLFNKIYKSIKRKKL